MALYTTCHMHNVPAGRERDYADWFDGPHRAALATLPGHLSADRYELTGEQIMVDIAQPWRFCSVYDLDTNDPATDVPALGPLLAQARDAGLIARDETERLFSYELYGDWEKSANWQEGKPLSGVSVLFGNYVAGRYDEYIEWYEKVHSPEVSAVPGHVGMKRGRLSPHQVEPRTYCPGDQLIYVAQQTDDLPFTIKDFAFRALGMSPSGEQMAPRSTAGSVARTIHYFRKVSGTDFWSDGIAYAGDLSVYPDDFVQAGSK